MYIQQGYFVTTATWSWVERLTAHLVEVLQVLKQLLREFFRWLIDAFGFTLFWFHKVLTQPSEWSKMVFYAAVDFVHTHIFLVHVLAWSAFFGPIIVLIPFLLAHEIFILVAYNLTNTLHGLLPGSFPDQYEALRLSLLDTRESLFSFVDRSSSVFNKWTSEHMPLMVLRLVGAALGSILLYAILIGW